MKVLGTFTMMTLEKYLKIKKNVSFRYFSNGCVGKVFKIGKMKFLGTFHENVGKVPKNGILKVLDTFLMYTLEKYLIKTEKWK